MIETIKELLADRKKALAAPGITLFKTVDFIISLGLVVLLALAVRAYVFEPVKVIGNSMNPTYLDGDRMICEKITYRFIREPQRGDVIICRYPGYEANCVKRIIALPGETVEIKGGKVYINGEELDESAYWNDTIQGDYEARTIGEGEVFVMGDNRNHSKDSRSPAVGPIPYNKIVGRVWINIYKQKA